MAGWSETAEAGEGTGDRYISSRLTGEMRQRHKQLAISAAAAAAAASD